MNSVVLQPQAASHAVSLQKASARRSCAHHAVPPTGGTRSFSFADGADERPVELSLWWRFCVALGSMGRMLSCSYVLMGRRASLCEDRVARRARFARRCLQWAGSKLYNTSFHGYHTPYAYAPDICGVSRSQMSEIYQNLLGLLRVIRGVPGLPPTLV